MKKTLNTSAIMNELREASAFFRKEPKTPSPLPLETKPEQALVKAQEPALIISPLPSIGEKEGTVFVAAEPLEREKKSDPEVSEDASKLESEQASIEANQQTSLLANQQTSKEENQKASNPLKKVGSYLYTETYKRMKRLAIDEDKPDYVILDEALNDYLQKKGY